MIPAALLAQVSGLLWLLIVVLVIVAIIFLVRRL